jgi:hypothetical protein
LYELMSQNRVTVEALALHEAAGKPATLVYAWGSAHLRVIEARAKLAGISARLIESDMPAANAIEAFADLTRGRICMLVTRRAYSAGPAITGIGAVMLLRSTRLAEPLHAILNRLRMDPPIAVIDLADTISAAWARPTPGFRDGSPEGPAIRSAIPCSTA